MLKSVFFSSFFTICCCFSQHKSWQYFQIALKVNSKTKPRKTPVNMCYWPSVRSRWLDFGQVLFSFACLWTETEHEFAKKERGQYSTILTEHTWSGKNLLYGLWGNFSCGTQRVVPSGQDSSILPARVANHSALRIRFILSAHGASHIVISYTTLVCLFFSFQLLKPVVGYLVPWEVVV